MNEPKEFEIREPRWMLIFGIVFMVLLISVMTVIIIFTALHKIVFDLCAGLLSILIVFLFISIICIVAYCTDKFAFRDGNFIYKSIFRKEKTIPVKNIFFAAVFYGKATTIIFKDKNNRRLLTVMDANEALKSDLFKYVIYYYNITVTDHKYNIINL